MSTYLLLHGFENRRPPGHWQHWLAGELRARGHEVRYPQLPEPDAPRLADWLDALTEHGTPPNDGDRPEGEFVVLAHSLGVLLWLHAVAAGRAPAADRVLLVAPPSPRVAAGIPEIAAFAAGPAADALTLALAPVKDTARLVHGDGDPYCPEGADRAYGIPLGLDMDHVPGGGHLNPGHGFGPWPAVLAWCENPEVRITAREG
ncbi:RBBP9/YdeN family alpha/beta hydrolase [Streptomyces sp. NPDC090025]|uniref:RBBP9/YdeN family alpha/beta hydrolase n=1 Tax=Streptomyces sp. NPDC090025 TaxID=3365922 RepID=UPI003839333D